MTSKVDKLPMETEPVAPDNNTILTLRLGDQTLLHLTQLIIIVGVSHNLLAGPFLTVIFGSPFLQGQPCLKQK